MICAQGHVMKSFDELYTNPNTGKSRCRKCQRQSNAKTRAKLREMRLAYFRARTTAYMRKYRARLKQTTVPGLPGRNHSAAPAARKEVAPLSMLNGTLEQDPRPGTGMPEVTRG